jgi:hypothetical protein
MTGSPEATPVAPAQPSLVEDFIDIWSSPSKVFARRREGPYWGPYFVTAILLAVLFYSVLGTMQAVFDAEIARAVAKMSAENPEMNGEAMAGVQRVMEGSMKIGGLVGLPIALLGLGLGVWLVAKILGGELSFGGGVMVASFAYLPKAIDLLLITLQSMVLDTSAWTSKFQWTLGVGRFMDPSGPQGMLNLLGRFDVFTIWVTILIAIGLVHAAKLPKDKAYLGAGIIFVLGAIPAVMMVASGQ